jgi:UDP-N-acetylglucosamine 2-epimerase (non-hydrolysing)
MAPVIKKLRTVPSIECRVIWTGQHREMLDGVLSSLGFDIDVDLKVMRPDHSLAELTTRLLSSFDELLQEERPALVLAQGDTTSVFAVSLACFYRKVPFGHVEAGLRTHDIRSPFPEEANRVLAGALARLHFAPTPCACDNLLRESVPRERIFVVGNTCIDSLLEMRRLRPSLEVPIGDDGRVVLVTAHRRESFGEPIRVICDAVLELAERNPDLKFLWPVHPNPNVQPVVQSQLGEHRRIFLTPSLPYDQFVAAMERSTLILTDSGGVQEEAPALGRPVLVLRAKSERLEAVRAGVTELVGTDRRRIVSEVERLLNDRDRYLHMSRGASPYGDGRAAERIASAVQRFLDLPADSAMAPPAEFDPAKSVIR